MAVVLSGLSASFCSWLEMMPEYFCLTAATVVVFAVESACWSDSSACWEALSELNEQLLKNGRHIETTRMTAKATMTTFIQPGVLFLSKATRFSYSVFAAAAAAPLVRPSAAICEFEATYIPAKYPTPKPSSSATAAMATAMPNVGGLMAPFSRLDEGPAVGATSPWAPPSSGKN